jgi:hypothetical protein
MFRIIRVPPSLDTFFQPPFRMAPFVLVPMPRDHRSEGVPSSRSRDGCAAVRGPTRSSHGPGMRRPCMPPTAGQPPRAVGV